MRDLFVKVTTLSFVLAVLIFSGCTEDTTTGPGTELPPVIEFINDSGFLSSSSDVAAGETFFVKVRVTAGDNDLSALRILADGSAIAGSRLTFSYDGTQIPTANNPQAIPDGAKQSSVWEIGIQAHDAEGTLVSYGIEVQDAAGNRDIVSLDVTTFGSLGVRLVEGTGYVSDDVTYDQPTTFTVRLAATRGETPLDQLSVLEDGAAVDASRLTIAGAAAGSNPYDLAEIDKNGFDLEIQVQSQDAGASDYTFKVIDEDGNSVEVTVTVSVGTPIDAEYTMVIVNNADGPVGSNGGLDLDTGQNVPAASADAELRDIGIDTNLPLDENWLQKIEVAPGSGATLKMVDVMAQPEGFTFDGVRSREAIIAAYDTSGAETTETEKLVVGDLFVVKRGQDFFILRVDNITVTASDNLDKYELSIKSSFE